jgi:hypothetical protein
VTALPLLRVWTDGSEVWAFDANGAYHKEGSNWVRTPLSTQGRVVSVSGSSATNLWVVQVEPSSVWRYNGTWTQMTTGASSPELAVAALSPTNVHVTGENGVFMRFNGSTWTEMKVPVLANMTMLAYTADDDVIAASERDIAHFNGTSWSTVRSPVDFVPNTLDYIPIVDLQASPGRIDMLTQRYRIRTLIRTRPLFCRMSETCDDGVDNDCDDKIDKADSLDCP